MKISFKAFENVTMLKYLGTTQKINTFTEKLRTDVGSVG
jgi:hypothetical protein